MLLIDYKDSHSYRKLYNCVRENNAVAVKKILETKQGEKYYVKDISKDYHMKYGTIKAEDMKNAKDGDILVSNKHEECVIYSPSFIDEYKKMKRLAQIPLLKDIGFFIAELGLGKESVIGDAGAGSGGVACFLANIVKKVYTFDIKDEHLDVVKENAKELGLTNIEIEKRSVYEELPKIQVDAFFLDVAEPWQAITPVEKVLKIGGFVVSYSPNLTSASMFVNTIKENKCFSIIKTIELIEQAWDVNDKKIKPISERLHSGFLTVARKIKN